MGSLQERSMSFDSVPSKAEVMGWNSQNLADYMRKLKLSGCNKVAMKGSITGTQFMQMTECELQVFPSCYVPIITKIQSDINKGDQKRASGRKSQAQKFPKQELVQKQEVWSSDEFENDSDYEVGHQEMGDDQYICALNEPQTYEQQEGEENDDEEYEMPSSADTVEPPRHLGKAKPQDHHHRDPVDDPYSVGRTSKPTHSLPQKMIIGLPPRPFKEPISGLHKKPRQPSTSQRDSTKSKGSTVKAPGSSSSKIPPKPPKSTDVSNRASNLTPAPPLQTPADMAANSTPGPSAVTNESGLDPCWYGGKMNRHQAEVALREMNKDGAFVVRDSSKGSAEHQYTLMLLKQGKVYNIKIRKEGNSYSLGTGLNNTKSFPGVKEMITHHTHNPLLLIDATDQSSEAQSKCCLLHPAGL